MNKYILFVLIFIFLCSAHNACAQSQQIDSLLLLLKSSRQDTNKVNVLNKLGKEYEFLDQKLSRKYINSALKLADSISYLKGKAVSYKYLGYLADDVSQMDSAIHYYQLSHGLFSKIKLEEEAADMLKLIGDVYSDRGEYSTALGYLQKAHRLFEKINSEDGIAGAYYSLGQLYQGWLQTENALKYYISSLEIYRKLDQPIDVANGLTAVGIMYNSKKDFESAKKYYTEAESIYLKYDYKNGLSNLYTWMAISAYDQKNMDGALEYFIKSLKLYEKLNNVGGLIYAYNNIGSIYADKKEYDKALEWEKKSLELALSSKSLEYIKYSHEILANTYGKKGDFKSAFEHQFQLMKYKDSIFNAASMEQINEMQTKYETEKKDKELIKKDAEILKQTAVADKQKTQRNYFLFGFALMLALSIFIFRSYRQKQKANTIIALQKEEVEKQKDLIEEKQKEIVASITYAQRLQQAILPPVNLFQQYLPDSFILNKPKDIVAGDFYWMYVKDRLIYIAAADCTGHGVPGALVSVVCSNALDRTIKEFNITEPGKILDKVRELVVETFEKSESEVKDGMDISLCLIDTLNKEIHWAGANNPLWYIESGVLKEIKANKQPIGKIDSPLPFKTHHLQLQKDDKLYLFSDGYADQFGGTKGKKFKYKNLQELILSNSNLPMNNQKEILDSSMEKWRGNLEQVDDILIVGIRI